MDECERILALILDGSIKKAKKALSQFQDQDLIISELIEIFSFYFNKDFQSCKERLDNFNHKIKSSEQRQRIFIFKLVFIGLIHFDTNSTKDAINSANDLKNIYDKSELAAKFIGKIESNKNLNISSDEKTEFLHIYNSNKELVLSSSWFVVSTSFFSMWKHKVGYLTHNTQSKFVFDRIPIIKSQVNLEKISNSNIIDPTLKEELDTSQKHLLKFGKVADIEFILVPEIAYNYLTQRYQECERIERKVVLDSHNKLIIDLFYANLTLVFFNLNKIKQVSHHPSLFSTIKDLCKSVLLHLELNQSEEILEKTKVWQLNKTKISKDLLEKAKRTTEKIKSKEILHLSHSEKIEDLKLHLNDYIFIDVSLKNQFINFVEQKIKTCSTCNETSNLNHCKSCSSSYCKSCDKKHKKISPRCEEKEKKSFNIFSCFCRSKSSKPSNIYKSSKLKKNQNTGKDEAQTSSFSTPSIQISLLRVTGLQNIGNTCYMNSALQCLIHCESLSKYFLDLDFSIITGKKLILNSYIKLIQDMCRKQSVISPNDLKKSVSKHNNYFAGYQQHDAQEFLSFLLASLHEELNQNPPNRDSRSSKSTADSESSEENWKRFKEMNKSIISDLFYGQLKSTVTCQGCFHQSETFDSFNCLSLPIPQLFNDSIELRFIPIRVEDELRIINIPFESGNNFFDIKAKAAKILKLDSIKIFEVREMVPWREVKYDDKFVRGTSRVLIEVPENSDFLGFFSVCFGKVEMQFRVLELSLTDSFESMLSQISDLIRPVIETADKNSILVDFYALSKNYILCFICNSPACSSNCKVLSSSTPISKCFANKQKSIYIRVKISNFKENTQIIDKFNTFKKLETPSSCLSIYNCLQAFTQTETLEKSDSWLCPKCKTKVKAEKKIQLYILPEVLIIHLKRFRVNKQFREKVNSRIKFPHKDLNLNQFIHSPIPATFDLFAVCNHHGSISGGHYTANVFSLREERWFECNDSVISESDLISESASYVLFYRAKSNSNHNL